MTTATAHIPAPTAADDAVVLRPANMNDADALKTLAALDSTAPLHGAILIAERSDQLVAALELGTGRSIADPFTPSAGLVALLKTRAEMLRRAAIGRRRRSLPLLQRSRRMA